MSALLYLAQVILILVAGLIGLFLLALVSLPLAGGIFVARYRRQARRLAGSFRCQTCRSILGTKSLERARRAARELFRSKPFFVRYRIRVVDAICTCGAEYRFSYKEHVFIRY
jgi:hypothetical protein